MKELLKRKSELELLIENLEGKVSAEHEIASKKKDTQMEKVKHFFQQFFSIPDHYFDVFLSDDSTSIRVKHSERSAGDIRIRHVSYGRDEYQLGWHASSADVTDKDEMLYLSMLGNIADDFLPSGEGKIRGFLDVEVQVHKDMFEDRRGHQSQLDTFKRELQNLEKEIRIQTAIENGVTISEPLGYKVYNNIIPNQTVRVYGIKVLSMTDKTMTLEVSEGIPNNKGGGLESFTKRVKINKAREVLNNLQHWEEEYNKEKVEA